jgi:molecular chaperone DnaK
MLVHVLQGEREKAEDNWSLGRFDLDFQPAKRGAARVGVQFEIDANGILNVLARDTSTGHEQVVQMKSAVDVDDAKVQKMVEESVEFAFEDMDARRWVESSMKAKEAVNAARGGLEEFEDELDDAKAIAAAIAGVEQILDKGGSGSGSLQHLKEEVTKLDEASLQLADLMMDRATEALLRKRGTLD